jgi:uncharacterized protein YndB with AHSA1/START domain
MGTVKLHFSKQINAPKEKVWQSVIGKDTYPQWTEAFSPGSHFVGDWSAGSKILFLGPDDKGQMGGMVSRIAENRPHDYISIEHLGMVKNGVEDTTSDEVKAWTPAFENYTFDERDGTTEFKVDMDSPEEYAESFKEMWGNALDKLKALAEA